MANDTHTPARSVRIPDALWNAAKAAAAADGRTVTDVIESALRRYVKSRGVTLPPPTERR